MDAAGERLLLIVRQAVEGFKPNPEQAFRQQAPVRAVAVLRSILQLRAGTKLAVSIHCQP
jgi:hypothetical protein